MTRPVAQFGTASAARSSRLTSGVAPGPYRLESVDARVLDYVGVESDWVLRDSIGAGSESTGYGAPPSSG
jgi:hypothetical protein